MRTRVIYNGAFLALVLLVTVGFFLVVRDFLQPVFWAAVLAVLFHPVQRKTTSAFGGRGALAAIVTLFAIVLIVLVPVSFVAVAVAKEAIHLYQRIASGDLDVQAPMRWIQERLPELQGPLATYGLEIERIQSAVSSAAVAATRFVAENALAVGQDTVRYLALSFVMLYVLFFFLRDGPKILDRIVRAFPLGTERQRRLMSKFADVARGTVKGTLVIGVIQGGIGGVMFWLLGIGAPVLWGAVMTVASILPAVGTGLVWLPASVVLALSGHWVKGIALALVGILVIGLVDNFLRPTLVGRDTKMPDYVILLSTLGGLTVFGITGLVLGPVLAALFLSVWEMFEEELESEESRDDVSPESFTAEKRRTRSPDAK